MKLMVNQKGSIGLISFVAILILLSIGVGFYFGQGFTKNIPEKTKSENGDLKPSIIPSSRNKVPSALSDWELKENDKCAFQLLLPPKKEPYYIPENPTTPPSATTDEGGFWHFYESSDGEEMFSTMIIAIFKHPEAASGYVPGLVQVNCEVNSAGLDNDSLLKKFEENFTNGTYEGLTLVEKKKISLWGRDVILIKIAGGMSDQSTEEYLFATKKAIFRVRKIVFSQTKSVKDATEKVFESLKFIE